MTTIRTACVALLLPALLGAQPKSLRISAEPACVGCRMEATRIFTVGAIPGATPGQDSHIARDSTGHYLLVVEPGPRVAVLDSTGKFIEFLDYKSKRADQSARDVTVRVDRDGGRNVYDGESWTSLRPADYKFRVGVLDHYRVLGTAVMGIPVSTTQPAYTPHLTYATLHMLRNPAEPAPEGFFTVENKPIIRGQQFERDSVISNPACRNCADLTLDVSFGLFKSTIWAATTDRYRLNLYYNWGSYHLQYIDVLGGWLPNGDSTSFTKGRTLPEAPRLTGLVFDQHGCKLTGRWPVPTDRSPDSQCERWLWTSGITFADSTTRNENTRYATMIDVIGASTIYAPRGEDLLTSARVVTRLKMPGRVELFGPGLAYQRRQLPDGKWTVDVYRLSVTEK